MKISNDYFCDYAVVFRGLGYVGAEVVEALGGRVGRGGLGFVSPDGNFRVVNAFHRTLISSSAASSCLTSRAIITMFTHFFVSCFTRLLPIPCEPPVMTIAYLRLLVSDP